METPARFWTGAHGQVSVLSSKQETVTGKDAGSNPVLPTIIENNYISNTGL